MVPLRRTHKQIDQSLGISAKFADGRDSDVVNTSTLIVKHVDEKTSMLILIAAFEWNTLWDRLHIFFCQCCIDHFVKKNVRLELDDYRAAAIERSRK